MKDKRVLYVSSEVLPYLPATEMSTTSFEAARKAHHKGVQTRIFMPRYGVINERRYQLHEVIRLSGMNLIVNDMDMPLIIKVASIPKERMQVYFIDNEEYFKRKGTIKDANSELFSDNDERAIFFAKGVIETVKKLNWAPDIIHVHGWMASLLPLYLKEYYKDDPLFAESKIVTSLYKEDFEGALNSELINKVKFDNISDEKAEILKDPSHMNILKSAIANSDGIIHGTEDISTELTDFVTAQNMPTLSFQPEETFADAYLDFYSNEVLN